MLRILILLLCIVAAGSGLAALADMPANIIISLPHWRIALAPIALAALALGALCLLWLAGALLKTLSAPLLWPQLFRRRRKKRAYQAVAQGLAAVYYGDCARAAELLAEAEAALPAEQEPLTALLALRLRGAQKAERKALFAPALPQAEPAQEALPPVLGAQAENRADMRLCALKARHTEAEAAGKAQAASAYAQTAAAENPALPWASLDAVSAAAQAGAWEQAAELYENFAKAWRKQAKRDKSAQTQAMLIYYRQVLLCAQAQAQFACHPHLARQTALQAHKLNPEFLPAALIAAQILFQLDEFRKAEKLLLAQWQRQAHPDIGRCFSSACGKIRDAGKQLARAQQLADSAHKAAPETQALLAQAGMAAGQYAYARRHAEQAQKQGENAALLLLLAKIAQAEGKQEEVARFLAQALTAPAAQSWRAEGVRLKHWQAFAPQSGRLGLCQWGAEAGAPAGSGIAAEDIAEFLPQNTARQATLAAAERQKAQNQAAETEAAQILPAARGINPAPAARQAPAPTHINTDNPGIPPAAKR